MVSIIVLSIFNVVNIEKKHKNKRPKIGTSNNFGLATIKFFFNAELIKYDTNKNNMIISFKRIITLKNSTYIVELNHIETKNMYNKIFILKIDTKENDKNIKNVNNLCCSENITATTINNI